MKFRIQMSRTSVEHEEISTSPACIRRRLYELAQAAKRFGFCIESMSLINPVTEEPEWVGFVGPDDQLKEVILEGDAFDGDDEGELSLLERRALPGEARIETVTAGDDEIAF